MTDYIGSKNLSDIDFIGKFENFYNEIYNLKKSLKISIKHHNYNNMAATKYKFSDYRSYYFNKENIDKVYFLYKKDFYNFGYNFENFNTFEKNKNIIFKILKKIIKRKFKKFKI